MNKPTDIQKIHFSKDDSAQTTIDQENVEKYIDRAEKDFRKERRSMWWNAYKVNYRNRHSDQVNMRKSQLD